MTQRTVGNKTQMKINPEAQEKYSVLINILKSLRFCIIILQHQAQVLHITAFKVSICIMDPVFSKPSTARLRLLLDHV